MRITPLSSFIKVLVILSFIPQGKYLALIYDKVSFTTIKKEFFAAFFSFSLAMAIANASNGRRG